MGLRQCEKCEEMVDEAKAFCPGCGHSFVIEEKRTQASNFDTADSTVQLGQTMYNQMLSDMGLNISKAPAPAEKRVEIIAPVATQVIPPAAKPSVEVKPAVKSSGNKKWVIAAVVVVALLFLLAIAIAALVLVYWFQFR